MTSFRPTDSLSGMLGPSNLSQDEIAILRCRAWREQELLIVPLAYDGLRPWEKLLLRRIAERLYEQGDTI